MKEKRTKLREKNKMNERRCIMKKKKNSERKK